MSDLIERQAVIEINRSYHGQMPNEVNHRIWKEINELPSAQPETHEERTETHACDCIERRAAIDAVKWGITYARAINTCTGETKELFKVSNHALNEAVERLKELPSAQADSKELSFTRNALDTISRQAAIDAHYEYCNKHPDAGFPVWSLKILEDLPSAQPEPHWIPVTDRLPEFKYETYDDVDGYTFWDTDFVIGTTSRGTLSIGQFTRDSDEPNEYHWDACECDAFDLQGCLRLGDHIIAWMPLPEPYREGDC